ncbi:hypothetical protein HZC08_00260 [Candidatus Micrarchaeota archaeon]|nr:hypothetical protein [Candidatus Micrarchaeota archaeon]
MELPPLSVDEKFPILKKSKSSAGIPELDTLLEGGYSHPGLVMLLGPTGMEKMAFAFHFAKEGLNRGEKVFYINSDSTPEDVRNKAASFGCELEDEKNFRFIDCYSSTLGSKAQTSRDIIVPGPSALNDLSLAINEAIKESAGKKMRVIFHSLSAFVLYNPKDSILKFIQVIGGRLKNADATVLLLVEDGMHEKQLLATLERSMDEKFVIHDRGGSFELELTSISASVPIKLTPAGIAIL